MTRGPSGCDKAPRGWFCIRFGGHTGSCAAEPTRWTQLVSFLRGRPIGRR